MLDNWKWLKARKRIPNVGDLKVSWRLAVIINVCWLVNDSASKGFCLCMSHEHSFWAVQKVPFMLCIGLCIMESATNCEQQLLPRQTPCMNCGRRRNMPLKVRCHQELSLPSWQIPLHVEQFREIALWWNRHDQAWTLEFQSAMLWHHGWTMR